MSKHINFVCGDTTYSNIVEYMKRYNIRNISSAIRILIDHGINFDEKEDKYLEVIRRLQYDNDLLREDLPF